MFQRFFTEACTDPRNGVFVESFFADTQVDILTTNNFFPTMKSGR